MSIMSGKYIKMKGEFIFMESKFIRGSKNQSVDGWKVLRYVYYPSGESACYVYNVAYWRDGEIDQSTEEFYDSEIIALNECEINEYNKAEEE